MAKKVKFSIMLFRTLTLWLIGLPITLFLFLVVLLSLPFSREGRTIHSIGAFWCGIILALSGVRVEMKGVENIPREGSFIYASNHRGMFDIPVLQAKLPGQFRWVSKKSLFSIPVIGWTMTLAGYVPIEREKASSAYRSIITASKKIKAGTSVLVFPEGTRAKTDTLLPFKRGLFLLATRSGAPLVPISITGTTHIMKSLSIFVRPSVVSVVIGKPIPTKDADEQELMKLTREAIEKGL